jgi:hypothetical protein
MSPADHKYAFPRVVQEFEPPRIALRPTSLESENDIPVAEVGSVHDLSEALTLSALARQARINGSNNHTHAA